jgi:hypothetical protein
VIDRLKRSRMPIYIELSGTTLGSNDSLLNEVFSEIVSGVKIQIMESLINHPEEDRHSKDLLNRKRVS